MWRRIATGDQAGASATPPRSRCLRSIGRKVCPSPSVQDTTIFVARRAAEDAGHRGVGGVAAGADPHQAVQVRQLRGVEHHPAAADEALEAGVEVRRFELVGVAGEVAGRNVQGPAQRDAEVREVAAHAGALGDRVEGRGHRVGRARAGTRRCRGSSRRSRPPSRADCRWRRTGPRPAGSVGPTGSSGSGTGTGWSTRSARRPASARRRRRGRSGSRTPPRPCSASARSCARRSPGGESGCRWRR